MLQTARIILKAYYILPHSQCMEIRCCLHTQCTWRDMQYFILCSPHKYLRKVNKPHYELCTEHFILKSGRNMCERKSRKNATWSVLPRKSFLTHISRDCFPFTTFWKNIRKTSGGWIIDLFVLHAISACAIILNYYFASPPCWERAAPNHGKMHNVSSFVQQQIADETSGRRN